VLTFILRNKHQDKILLAFFDEKLGITFFIWCFSAENMTCMLTSDFDLLVGFSIGLDLDGGYSPISLSDLHIASIFCENTFI